MATLKGFNNDHRYFFERWTQTVCEYVTWSWFTYNRRTKCWVVIQSRKGKNRAVFTKCSV